MEEGSCGFRVVPLGGFEASGRLVEALRVEVVVGHTHLAGDGLGVEAETVVHEFEAHGARSPDELDQLGGELGPIGLVVLAICEDAEGDFQVGSLGVVKSLVGFDEELEGQVDGLVEQGSSLGLVVGHGGDALGIGQRDGHAEVVVEGNDHQILVAAIGWRTDAIEVPVDGFDDRPLVPLEGLGAIDDHDRDDPLVGVGQDGGQSSDEVEGVLVAGEANGTAARAWCHFAPPISCC